MEIFNATNLLYIWGGFVKTIEISALSIFFSLIFGTVLALVKSYAPRPFRILVSAYIELFRCTPNLLWILFIYFTVQGLDIVISTIAFTLFTSAVMAEIVRGGLNSIPRGQFEAAQSQGFGFFATMRYIILPALSGTLVNSAILAISGSLSSFALIFAMTGGGPSRVTEIISIYMYNNAFLGRPNFALANAIALITVAISFLLIMLTKALEKRFGGKEE